MTTITQVLLVPPMQLAASDTAAVYTAPSLTTVKISRAVFCNTTAFAVTITAGLTTGGANSASTTLISARSVAPGETYVSPELVTTIPAGSTLRAYASAATAITFSASGITIV